MIHRDILINLLFFLIISLSSLCVVESNNNKNNVARDNGHDKLWDHYQVAWDESLDAFVPYPKDAYPLLERRNAADPYPVVIDVSGTVSDWDQPIFALLKGIVHRNHRVLARPHFYVQDGTTAQCRKKLETPTTRRRQLNNDNNNNNPQQPANCTRHCTNHGRYCLEHPEVPGAELVMEATRRMCFEYILHDVGNMQLFQYIEGFQKAECHTRTGTAQDENDDDDDDDTMSKCSQQVLDELRVMPNKGDMEDCLGMAGGFDTDDFNLALEEELQYQDDMVLPRTIQEAQAVLPVIEIDGQPYTSHYTVKDIFKGVCDAFPDNGKPVACDFCSDCQDVRKCLWHLECDGEAFDVNKLMGPDEALEAESSSSSSSTSVINFGSPSGWEVGFVWGLAGGLTIAAFFMVREIRSRRKMAKDVADMEDLSWQPEPLGLPNLDNVVDSLSAKNHGPLDAIEESDTDSYEGDADAEEPTSKPTSCRKKRGLVV